MSVFVYGCVHTKNFFLKNFENENVKSSKKYRFIETENLVSSMNLMLELLVIFILDLHPN